MFQQHTWTDHADQIEQNSTSGQKSPAGGTNFVEVIMWPYFYTDMIGRCVVARAAGLFALRTNTAIAKKRSSDNP